MTICRTISIITQQ